MYVTKDDLSTLDFRGLLIYFVVFDSDLFHYLTINKIVLGKSDIVLKGFVYLRRDLTKTFSLL